MCLDIRLLSLYDYAARAFSNCRMSKLQQHMLPGKTLGMGVAEMTLTITAGSTPRKRTIQGKRDVTCYDLLRYTRNHAAKSCISDRISFLSFVYLAAFVVNVGVYLHYSLLIPHNHTSYFTSKDL